LTTTPISPRRTAALGVVPAPTAGRRATNAPTFTPAPAGALPADYRYPFAPFPTGWYLVAESTAVGPGDVMPMRWFGRDLVLYRTESGQAVVADAHCPHMGAHLGYGGVVDREGIRCPFHSWRFDTDGRCDQVPYATRAVQPRTGVASWPVHETCGLILVHHDEAGRAPTWHMPDVEEWGAPGWLGYTTCSWKIRMHVQELAENIPDTVHFLYVHTVPAMPDADVETDGHVYRQVTSGKIDGVEVWRTTQEAFGLGLVWLHGDGPMRYKFLTATTPIDAEHVELRLLFLSYEGEGATEVSEASRQAIQATIENTGRDVPIWEHKVYRDRPPLVPGDGPIGLLRSWASQFHPTV